MTIVHFLDDINQPLSCKQWGDTGTAGIPPIIDDGSPANTVFEWFENPNGNGIYPLIVFINHELVIDRIMGTSPSPTMANLLIENMLNHCSEGFDCNGNCGGSATLDECGVCGGNGGCDCDDGIISCGCCCPAGQERDCTGVCNGPGLINTAGDGSCCATGVMDCANICDGYSVADLCGICGGGETDVNNCLSIYNHFTVTNQFNIQQLYPNPFNPVLNIDFEINQAGWVKVNITDITGSMVKTVYEGFEGVGKHQINWDSETLPSGTYFVTLELNEFLKTKKVVLLK